MLSGKELVCAALRGEKTERAPWVPFVGCHAGSLIKANATDYLKSADLIVSGMNEAIRRYRPDGIPVLFDLQVEAEILGCDLVWADENPPAVTSHPLAEGRTLSELRIPQLGDGRLPLIMEACRRLRQQHPDKALYGLITGPFTLAMHLQGTDLFMGLYDQVADVTKLMEFCRDVCIAMAGYYLDAGCDVIALVDPMTSQIGPEQFKEFVEPYARPVFKFVRQRQARSSFFVCGQAQQNVSAMADCGPDNISVDENIPLDYVRDICLKRGLSFGGNMQLTIVLLLGSPEDAQRNAVACLEIGGAQGFVLSPGCDLPYSTPAANLEAVAEVVHNPYQRSIVKTLAATRREQGVLNMSDYGQTDKVVVDIITLDSEACAPCQYMVEAVRKVAPEFEGIVIWREHKIKQQESLVFMTSLMVKNIPTICIDGHITFVSRIPPRDELVNAIQKRINEKLRGKIKQRRAALHVLGKTEAECAPVKANIIQAVRELGADIDVLTITDAGKILAYGVMRTPAVVLSHYQIKAEGRIPEVLVIKEWIKDL